MDKNNEFLKEIKREFSKIEIPNVKNQIKAKYYFQRKNQEVIQKNSFFIIKRIFTMAVTSFVVVFSIFIGLREINSNPINNPIIIGEKNTFTFQAFSSVNLISADYGLSNLNYDVKNDKDKTDYHVDEIHNYLFMIDQILSINKGLDMKTSTSSNPDYEYQDTITINSALNETTTYIIYYNIEKTKTEENKEEYSYTGVLILNNTTYQLLGSSKFENNEKKIDLKAMLNDNNYVIVEQKIDNQTEKFTYTIAHNGIETITNIRVSKENEGINVRMTFEDSDNKSNYTFKQEIKGNEKTIKIQINDNNGVINLVVKVIIDDEGNEFFEYKGLEDGKVITKDKNNKKDKIFEKDPINQNSLFVYYM